MEISPLQGLTENGETLFRIENVSDCASGLTLSSWSAAATGVPSDVPTVVRSSTLRLLLHLVNTGGSLTLTIATVTLHVIVVAHDGADALIISRYVGHGSYWIAFACGTPSVPSAYRMNGARLVHFPVGLTSSGVFIVYVKTPGQFFTTAGSAPLMLPHVSSVMEYVVVDVAAHADPGVHWRAGSTRPYAQMEPPGQPWMPVC